ncbi:MAG TPA: phosphoglucosamine mutase, partial [Blastocatellia bacterium]|nr:phosphoglucosamine mutase [Blastocatellia bacterium]
GDADRALFIDRSGNLVDGDSVLWILANYFSKNGELPSGRVVSTVMS